MTYAELDALLSGALTAAGFVELDDVEGLRSAPTTTVDRGFAWEWGEEEIDEDMGSHRELVKVDLPEAVLVLTHEVRQGERKLSLLRARDDATVAAKRIVETAVAEPGMAAVYRGRGTRLVGDLYEQQLRFFMYFSRDHSTFEALVVEAA